MSTRLLLDGENLAGLMLRVRTEMGPDAVVVKAERVRSGGVAGFFAKEHFELTVEVPEPRAAVPWRPATHLPSLPGPPPERHSTGLHAQPMMGLHALLEAADAAEGHRPDPDGSTLREEIPVPRTTGRRVSTDADTFTSLLASIDDMAERPGATAAAGVAVAEAAVEPGEAAGATAAGATAVGGSAVSSEPAEGLAPDAEADHHQTVTRMLPAARFAAPDAVVTAAMYNPIPVVPFDDPDELDEHDAELAAARDAEREQAREQAREQWRGAAREQARQQSPGPRSDPRSQPEPRWTSPAPRTGTGTGGGDRRAMLALGVPAALLGEGPLDEPMPISELLASLGRPPALLRTFGSIVAVVGDSAQAFTVASQMAARVGQTPHDVVLAGEMLAVAGHGRRLLGPPAAAWFRSRIAGGQAVSIVAVGVGTSAEDWPGSAELLAELEPDQTWAVVDARLKPADLRHWMRAVGGGRMFDVAAASNVLETQEPGTVLDLDLPVGWIDGLPATPMVWAAALSERLDVGARWD